MEYLYPNYKQSVLNVSSSILKHYGRKPSYPSLKPLDKLLDNDYDHIIYILLDGMGLNILNHHLRENDLLKKHLYGVIQSVFPTTTVAATNAVLSGTAPIVNGQIAWTQYFPNEDTNLVVFQNYDFYTLKKPNIDLRKKYLSYKSISNQIKEQHNEVFVKEYFPSFEPSGYDSFLEEIQGTLKNIDENRKTYSYLYWNQPDFAAHTYGCYSKEVNNIMRQLNKDYTHLINEIPDKTAVITIADHGLIDVEQINFFDYHELAMMLLRKPSFEPRVTNFFVKKGLEREFELKFNEYFQNSFKLYKASDLIIEGWFGNGVKHKLIDSIFGNYISVAISNKMFSLNEKSYRANHGSITKDEMEVPLIFFQKYFD